MGRVAVPGASPGLAAEMPRLCAARGWDPARCARRTERLDALAEEIRTAAGRRVETAALDVTDPDAVPAVFRRFDEAFGGFDRVVVNAGLGKGAPLGTGRADANRETAMTNFVGALAQCEAALEVFRRQRRGHLVLVSSMSALRGMRRSMTTYAATKAGVAALAEGIRADLLGTGVKVTTVYPGYIVSEANPASRPKPMMVPTARGVRAMVQAIERERPQAKVPAWPWVPLGFVMRHAPLRAVARFS